MKKKGKALRSGIGFACRVGMQKGRCRRKGEAGEKEL